jgi:hypothetical protein
MQIKINSADLLRIFILVIIVCFHLSGQTVRRYEGAIGNAKVAMTLNFFGSTVKGSYYYKAVGQRLNMTGEIKSNLIKLEAYVPDTSESPDHEYFNGKIDQENISGTWNNETNKLSFNLKLIKEEEKWELEEANLTYKQSKKGEDYLSSSIHYEYMLPNENTKKYLHDSILTSIFDTEGVDKDNLDNSILIMNAIKTELRDPDHKDYWWEENANGEVCFIVGNVLTYKESEYHQFTGSSGRRSSKFVVVNLINGKHIGPSDVIKEGMEKEVLQIIGPKNGFGIETFYVTEKGIGFLFTTWNTSFQDDTYDYYVPFSKIKQYLRDDFLELLK